MRTQQPLFLSFGSLAILSLCALSPALGQEQPFQQRSGAQATQRDQDKGNESTRATAKGETGRSRAEGETRDDLAMVQGKWERVVKGHTEGPVARVLKEVKGNKEIVTYFDDAGKVIRQHQVDFVLDSAGPVKVFTFSNQEILEGPDKGRKYPGTVSYVYRVGPREFGEIWGFLPGQEERPTLLLVWKRVKEDESDSDRQPAVQQQRRESQAQGQSPEQRGQARTAGQSESKESNQPNQQR